MIWPFRCSWQINFAFFYLDTLELSLNNNGQADARNYSGEEIEDIQDAPLKLLVFDILNFV